MRSASTLHRGAALLTMVILLAVPVTYADDVLPIDPPEARISPPVGASGQDAISVLWTQFFIWLSARISPPVG